MGAKGQTHEVLWRGRHSSCQTLDFAKTLIFWQSSSAECCAGIMCWLWGHCGREGWFCEQEQPMGLGQCWFHTQCSVLSQLHFPGVWSPECFCLERRRQGSCRVANPGRPRWGCCCCSGSHLGSNRMLTLWDVGREGVVYLKYPGKEEKPFLGLRLEKDLQCASLPIVGFLIGIFHGEAQLCLLHRGCQGQQHLSWALGKRGCSVPTAGMVCVAALYARLC